MKRILKVFMFGLLVLGLTACKEEAEQPQEEQQQQEEQSQEEQQQEVIEVGKGEQAVEEGQPPTVLEAATTVIRALKHKDMATVASWAHVKKGVRFSPYAYVDVEQDLAFREDDLKDLLNEPTNFIWRTFPGSGEVIELPYSSYHDRFVYNKDFLNEAEVALNEGLGEGAMINNLNEVYPKETHDFVEYHVAGSDPNGMDWGSLRLVFEKIGEDYALVGIIHDQWTP